MAAEIFDPSQQTTCRCSRDCSVLLVLAIFVAIGGHRMVMAGLLDTFQTIPPGKCRLRPIRYSRRWWTW